MSSSVTSSCLQVGNRLSIVEGYGGKRDGRYRGIVKWASIMTADRRIEAACMLILSDFTAPIRSVISRA